MAGLSKANLRKELLKGPFKGKSTLSVIAHKIENQSPFELVGRAGEDFLLSFNSQEIRNTFLEEDWDYVESNKFKGNLSTIVLLKNLESLNLSIPSKYFFCIGDLHFNISVFILIYFCYILGAFGSLSRNTIYFKVLSVNKFLRLFNLEE